MAHKAEIVETKLVADGAVAICVRCCDDASTDSWHTLYGLAGKTDADLDAWESTCVAQAEEKHANTLAALAYIKRKKV